MSATASARMGAPVVLALTVGCYQPSAADGAPCGPERACPTGQQCDPYTERCLRELSTPPLDGTVDTSSPDAMSPDAAPASVFFDDFQRADAADLGNGWIEKNPTVFHIAGGEVPRIATSPQSYRDNLVYRPSAEDVLDVEISTVFRLTALPPRFPQIFVRADPATITGTDSYDGYLLYVAGATVADQVVLGRQRGAVFVTTLSVFTLSSPLDTTGTSRLTLRVEGTSPVQLSARVERRDGATWAIIGQTEATDSDPARLVAPGTVGFAGDEGSPYVYDDFQRTRL